MDLVYLDFTNASDIVSHKISSPSFLKKLMKHGLEEQTVRWDANWLIGQAQRPRQPVTSSRGQYSRGQY